jgi:hypothetical protein
MRLGTGLSRIIAFLRAGYAAGAPATGYVPLLALLRRRATDTEVIAIARKLIARQRQPINAADIGVEITRVTDEMPTGHDIARVQQRLAAIGWSGDHPGPQPEQPSTS